MRTVLVSLSVALALVGALIIGSPYPATAQGNAQRTVIGALDPDGKVAFARGPLTCDQSVAVNITSATTTSLVAVVTAARVFVCHASLMAVGAATAVTVKFVYGTGAACSTPTDLTGAFTGATASTASTPIVLGPGMGYAFKTPVSNGVCAVTTGTAGLQGFVSFAQF
jgi:hypothetical protein